MLSFDEAVERLKGWAADAFDTPEKAFSQCYDSSADCQEVLGWDNIDWQLLGAATLAPSDVVLRRFEELRQCSDHFTIYHEKLDRVVDFTFRQFDEDAPYPLICSKQEWVDRLAKAWDTPKVAVSTGCEDVDSAIAMGEADIIYCDRELVGV